MTFAHIQPLTQWLHQHPHWAEAVTFFVAMAESLALIGTIIPGSVTLAAIGTLIGAHVIPAAPTIAWGIIGAISGDAISYFAGFYFHDRIRQFWIFKRYPNLLDRGEQFFKRHGGKSVVIGRFIGPVRAVIPLIAGMLNMSRWRFFAADIASAIVWAPVYMLPGIFLGAAALEMAPETAAWFMFYLLAGLITLALFAWLFKWVLHKIFLGIDWLCQKTWALSPALQRTLSPWIASADEPQTYYAWRLLVGAVTSAIVVLLMIVSINSQLIADINTPVFYFFRSLYSNWGARASIALTFLAEKSVVGTVVIAVSLWFLYRKRFRLLTAWVSNSFLVFGGGYLLKFIMNISRPPGLMVIRQTSSFPSGHMLLTVGIFGSFAALMASQLPRMQRHQLYLPVIVLTGLMGLSRLYLGAHWLTDVIAGSAYGLAIVCLTTLWYRRQAVKPCRLQHALLVALSSLTIAWLAFFVMHFHQQRYAYTPYWPTRTLTMQQWWQQEDLVQPLYRLSRTGKPIALFNVQWLGSLNAIQKQLNDHGWRTEQRRNLASKIKHFTFRPRQPSLPLLTQLYQDRQPALVMTKPLTAGHLLVLRLWPSSLYLADNTKPLWLGSTNYALVHQWRGKNRLSRSQPNAAVGLLQRSIQGLPHRQQRYETETPWGVTKTPEFAKILLIRTA